MLFQTISETERRKRTVRGVERMELVRDKGVNVIGPGSVRERCGMRMTRDMTGQLSSRIPSSREFNLSIIE